MALTQKAKSAWELDVGPIDDSDWGEILEGTKTASPKMLDRLTQLYIIHRSYLMPQSLVFNQHVVHYTTLHYLSSWHILSPVMDLSNYANILASGCPLPKMGSPVALDPKLCLLGLLPDADIDKYLATFMYETLFLARKTVDQTWMQALPPTIQRWKRDINDTLLFQKLIYTHRGCPLKYYKVWDRCLGGGETCT